MVRLRTCLAALAAASCAPFASSGSRTITIARKSLPATVTVMAFSTSGDTVGQGSGFIAASNGTVVTAWHVLCRASRVTVEFESGGHSDRATFLAGDSVADVVLLRIGGDNLPFLPMTSAIPPIGSPVVAIGSPLGFRGTVSEGIVSAIRADGGLAQVQFTGDAVFGSSGGPVLDDRGRVFAIVSSGIPFAPGLNFAISVRPVLALMAQTPTASRFAAPPESRPPLAVSTGATPFSLCRLDR